MQKMAEVFELKVKFGKLSVGETSVSLPIAIDRGQFGRSSAAKAVDENFVAKRLTCRLIKDGGDSNQPLLPGMKDKALRFEATAESKTASLRRNAVGATLNFLLSDLDVELVTHFANQAGTLEILGSEVLPEPKRGRPAKAESDEGDEEDEGDE